MTTRTDLALPVADRVASLRKRLGLTQEQVAERSEGRLKRTEVVKLESGLNKATSDKIRSGLAAAFGVSRDQMASYLDGAINLDQLVRPATILERTSRYPNLDEAIRFWRISGGDEEAIEEMLSIAAEAAEDPSPMVWLDQIKAVAARLKFQRKAPADAQRERDADLHGQALLHQEADDHAVQREAKIAAYKAKKLAQG